LKLLRATVDTVKTYAAVMNIDPETSPFIQRLLEAVEGEGPHEAGASASQSTETSDPSEGSDSPLKGKTPVPISNDRKAQAHGVYHQEAVASSSGIWGWVLKLPHKFGLTKQ